MVPTPYLEHTEYYNTHTYYICSKNRGGTNNNNNIIRTGMGMFMGMGTNLDPIRITDILLPVRIIYCVLRATYNIILEMISVFTDRILIS